MRVLSIETSSPRGSVALAEASSDSRSGSRAAEPTATIVCALDHHRENAHGESMLPMIDQALALAGWNRRQLDRIAVGIGPGSFTGLRVGIALAQGLSEGLGVPLVGVPSLQAMALAVPRERPGCRCVLSDARKGEAFLAAYHADGREALGVQLVASLDGVMSLTSALPEPVFVGNGVELFPGLPTIHRSPDSDQPHARWTARAAVETTPPPAVRPLYVRDAGAAMPERRPHPLRPLAQR